MVQMQRENGTERDIYTEIHSAVAMRAICYMIHYTEI